VIFVAVVMFCTSWAVFLPYGLELTATPRRPEAPEPQHLIAPVESSTQVSLGPAATCVIPLSEPDGLVAVVRSVVELSPSSE